MKMFVCIVFASVCVASSHAIAGGPDDILGLWNTEKREAMIKIYNCSSKYCGKIVWLNEPNYSADSKEGTPGAPILDHNNPNPELRMNPLIGSQILFDIVYAGENVWEKGKIYDSDNGKIYNSKMTLISPDQLNMRGFIGISFIGGSTIWTRTKTVTK
jgi:uncharacterized protein (DUF2147 family)